MEPDKPNREGHTEPILMWRQACEYVRAANEIPKYRTARLHLAAHGIELALKSFLRTKGYSLKRLKREPLGHSLTGCAAECERHGMQAPPGNETRRHLDAISEAHVDADWRYLHTDGPRLIDRRAWIRVAEWALRASMPAVAEQDAAGRQSRYLAQSLRRMESDLARTRRTR